MGKVSMRKVVGDNEYNVGGDDEDQDDNVLEPQRGGVVHMTAGLLLYYSRGGAFCTFTA